MTDPVSDLQARRRTDPFNEGADAARARRLRSIGIAVVLVLLVALIFAIGMIKLAARVPHG